MSALAVRNKNGEKIYYSGSQFDGFENIGTHHLCVRTGSGENDVRKYGLTSTPLNDKYKALRMKIPDNATGKDAYIAQKYVKEKTIITEEEFSNTRSSQYTETETFASTTSITKTSSTKSASQPLTYYGKQIKTSSYSQERSGPTYNVPTPMDNERNLTGSFLINTSANFSTSSTHNFVTVIGGPWNYTETFSNLFSMTDYKTSYASTYEYDAVINIESKMNTFTSSRSSEYTSSSNVSTTISEMTHNANL